MFCLPKACYAIGTADGQICVSMASVQICGSVHLVHTPTSLCMLVVPASPHNWAAQYPMAGITFNRDTGEQFDYGIMGLDQDPHTAPGGIQCQEGR